MADGIRGIAARESDRAMQARVALLLNQPFFGSLCTRMDCVPARADWCPRAATDGMHIYFNPLFFQRLDDREMVFVVAHEIGHCMFKHFSELETERARNTRVLNIAQDYVINNMLDTEICGTKVIGDRRILAFEDRSYAAFPRREILVPYLDHAYDGWTSLEIYDHLMESGGEGGIPGGHDLVDSHIPVGGDAGSAEPPLDSDGLATAPAATTREDAERIGMQIDDAVVNAASSQAGRLPAGLARSVGEFRNPKMRWQDAVPQTLAGFTRSVETYRVPNRKCWHTPAVLPGREPPRRLEACAAFDTSGSVDASLLRQGLGDLRALMEEFEEFSLRVWQFDGAVHNDMEVASEDSYDLRDWRARGGGGTLFGVNWDHMRNLGISPAVLIVFTDGQPADGHWGDGSYCETVFVVYSKRGAPRPEAPFGMTFHVDA